MQEQSGWLLACLAQKGWLGDVSQEQWNSFLNALEGFYRKCGIDLVREQIETNFTRDYPYDIDNDGLLIWPTVQFDVEILASLTKEGLVRPVPAAKAADAGLVPIAHEKIRFSATYTEWQEWERIWSTEETNLKSDLTKSVTASCTASPTPPIVLAIR